MSPPRRPPFVLAVLASALALAACGGRVGPRTAADALAAGLDLALLDVAEVPKTTPLDPAPVGGLSALAWAPDTGVWYALSDDAGMHGAPPRLVTLEIALEDGRLDPDDVAVTGVLPLRAADGGPLMPGGIDPEGLVRATGGAFFVSSEGATDRGVAPGVREIRPDGVTRRELPVPTPYLPPGEGEAPRGVRPDYGFESLTITPDGSRLITAGEVALVQDGPRAVFGVASRARVLVLDAASGATIAEHVYEVDPAPWPAVGNGQEVAGLVELLALGDGRFLALERVWVEGHGNRIRLYATALTAASEVTGARRLPRRVAPMPKRLLLDFADLGVPLDNVEGMALGPVLADGRRALLFLADDNFSPQQRSLVYAFAVSGSALPPPPAAAPTARVQIARIQGAAHRSPLEGQRVTGVTGVVTAVPLAGEEAGRPAAPEGFWIEDPIGDDDPATSEGLWVRLAEPDPVAGVAVGDVVEVGGRVAELGYPGELTTTTLVVDRGQLRIVGRGGDLPGPHPIGGDDGDCPPRPAIDDDGLTRFEPAEDGIDFWEAREAMRLALVAPLVVGPTSRHGEIALVAADCAPTTGRTARGGLLVAPGDFHPERILADDRLSGPAPQVAVGDRFGEELIGVVAYSFGNFKLLPTGPWPAVETAGPPPEAPLLPSGPDHLTLATLNVENLSVRDDAAKLEALAQVVGSLGAPAIVALQEVQDDSGRADDGTVTAAATLDRLVAAIAAAGLPQYQWRQVDPEDNADGGAPGGNIRVAFLLDPARVRPVDRGSAGPDDAVAVVRGEGGPSLSISPGRVAPGDPAFRGDPAAGGAAASEPSRKPLAIETRVAGRPLFLVAVHFRSKGGDDPLSGAVQPPRLATEPQRVAQAEAVAGFVADLLAVDPDARVVVLGDFNDFPFRPPLAALGSVGLVNLIARVPGADRYTYVYEGNSQVLDQILVSPALAAVEAGVDAVHLHADFPPARRSSDHDPVVARFRLPPPP